MVFEKPVDEKEFFFGFKQIDVDDYVDKIYFKFAKKNESSRKIFFTSMCGIDKKIWTKFKFYRSFQLLNFFNAMTKNQFQIIPSNDITGLIDKFHGVVNPPVVLRDRGSYAFYQIIPRECYIDFLTYLQIEEFQNKFKTDKGVKFNAVLETSLKIVMKDFGIQDISDNVINLALMSYDKINRRTYDLTKVIKTLITIHAIASERKRAKKRLTEFKIKVSGKGSGKKGGKKGGDKMEMKRGTRSNMKKVVK